MPFTFEPLDLPGVVLVVPRVFADSRGSFFEAYQSSAFREAIPENFVQDNESHSKKGTVRGLHFQKGAAAQGKLVRCLAGAIWDVAVDLRPGSATFGRWAARTLTSENRHMLFIPAGFAHGFQVISDEADVLYKCTTEYAPQAEGGLIWNDPDLALPWPIAEALLSEKDAILPTLAAFEAERAGAAV